LPADEAPARENRRLSHRSKARMLRDGDEQNPSQSHPGGGGEDENGGVAQAKSHGRDAKAHAAAAMAAAAAADDEDTEDTEEPSPSTSGGGNANAEANAGEEVAEKVPMRTRRRERVSTVPAAAMDDGDEVSEDGMALLPRHTKVLVTGNNRTKSALVGLKGVVKKAVGLGGWHWLVLSDGTEVRLQRNALHVLEQPTGEESDSESEDEVRQRPSAHASGDAGGTAAPHQQRREKRRPRLDLDLGHQPLVRRSVERKREIGGAPLYVNFHKLEAAALRRYRRHYELQVKADATKDQLVHAVGTHFTNQKVDERKVIHTFFETMMEKRLRTS